MGDRPDFVRWKSVTVCRSLRRAVNDRLSVAASEDGSSATLLQSTIAVRRPRVSQKLGARLRGSQRGCIPDVEAIVMASM